MNSPLISIIIPIYNMGKYLLETLQSLEKVYNPQLHEVLIINDGSNDAYTLKILNDITKYNVIHQENKRMSGARNTGIKNATGKYILFLDSDNLITNIYFTKGIELLENNPEIDIIYGDSEMFEAGSGILKSEEYCLQTLMSYNYIDTCTLSKRSIFIELGGFDENMKSGLEDWELWMRFAFSNKKFHYLKNNIVQKYRVRSDSVQRSISKKETDKILNYLAAKHPSYLNYESLSNFYYNKFDRSPIGWTLKLFIRKYIPLLYKKLVNKGKLRNIL